MAHPLVSMRYFCIFSASRDLTASLLGLCSPLLFVCFGQEMVYSLQVNSTSSAPSATPSGVIFVWTFYTSRDLPTFTFLAYGFLFSFFCGYQFPLAAEMIGEWKNPASGCLAADLTGAAVGAFATGAVLIPTWGAQAAIFFLLLIKISSNIITLFISRKWRPDMSSAPRN
jgi:hypothetical protein